MPEPTDHRAEAERWLEMAEEDDFVDVPDMTDVVASALISIGHALLALGQRQNITADELRQALPKICTHREQVPGFGEKGCALWPDHPGEHRLTVFSPAPHPPLSPSEG